MNDLDYLVPSRARLLPPGSKERAFGQLSLRQLWHTVYDPCPGFLKTSPDDGAALLEPFLEHAARERLSMRWPLHAHLLLWLKNRKFSPLGTELAEELLAAAAARWAYSDQSARKGIVLYFPEIMPETGVAAWKSSTAEESHRIVQIRMKRQARPNEALAVSLLSERGYPDTLIWASLPL